MKTAAEYRQHAEECRTLARQLIEGERRNQILKMAKTWDSLAGARKALFRHARVTRHSTRDKSSVRGAISHPAFQAAAYADEAATRHGQLSVESSYALRSLKDELYGSCQFVLVEVIAAEAVKDGAA